MTQELRVLHGCVSSAGVFVSGTIGWTVAKIGTGSYTVSFTQAFGSAPTMLVTTTTGQATTLATPSSANVSTYNIGGVVADQSFYWLAVL